MCPRGQKAKDVFINKICENGICNVSFLSLLYKKTCVNVMLKQKNVRFLSMTSSPLGFRCVFSPAIAIEGVSKGSAAQSLREANHCHALLGQTGPGPKTHPELPERALAECERDLQTPRKRLQRFDQVNIFACSSNSLCEQTAPLPRGNANEGRAREHRGPNVPRFSLDDEIKVHDRAPRVQRGYGNGKIKNE